MKTVFEVIRTSHTFHGYNLFFRDRNPNLFFFFFFQNTIRVPIRPKSQFKDRARDIIEGQSDRRLLHHITQQNNNKDKKKKKIKAEVRKLCPITHNSHQTFTCRESIVFSF